MFSGSPVTKKEDSTNSEPQSEGVFFIGLMHIAPFFILLAFWGSFLSSFVHIFAAAIFWLIGRTFIGRKDANISSLIDNQGARIVWFQGEITVIFLLLTLALWWTAGSDILLTFISLPLSADMTAAVSGLDSIMSSSKLIVTSYIFLLIYYIGAILYGMLQSVFSNVPYKYLSITSLLRIKKPIWLQRFEK